MVCWGLLATCGCRTLRRGQNEPKIHSTPKWWFPEIGVPPVIIHFWMRFSLAKTIQLWGYPHFRKPANISNDIKHINQQKQKQWTCIIYQRSSNSEISISVKHLFFTRFSRIFTHFPYRFQWEVPRQLRGLSDGHTHHVHSDVHEHLTFRRFGAAQNAALWGS